MTSPTATRSNLHPWSPAFATAPPPSCHTLRNHRNTVDWGYTCQFGQEDGAPVPFSIDTACMPWITPNVYPSAGAFYSPATACPSAWSAVSTATTGEHWVSGETGLSCCPEGFEGDGRGGCRAESGRTVSVVECGEADADENELSVYTAGQWPVGATASVAPLQLRYRARDVGSASGSPSSTNTNTNTAGAGLSSGGGASGLSIGVKAAIGTVIPLFFIVGALALWMGYRRRKHKKHAMALAARNRVDEKHTLTSHTSSTPLSAVIPAHHASPSTEPHETPEWNVEMDATEAGRQKSAWDFRQYDPGSAVSQEAGASELDGVARVRRKQIEPVELDGRSVAAGVGGAYVPYRPGVR